MGVAPPDDGAFPLDVGPGPVEGSSQTAALQLGLLQVLVEREDQAAQSGVLIRQVCPVGVVELSSQVGDAFVSVLDGRTECLGDRFGVQRAFPP